MVEAEAENTTDLSGIGLLQLITIYPSNCNLKVFFEFQLHVIVSKVCVIVITLRASCSAVYCNRSCLFVCGWMGGGCVCLWVGVWVDLLPRLLEIACIDLHQTGSVCKGYI